MHDRQKKWNMWDGCVLVLCNEEKILNVKEEGRDYQIHIHVQKPDGRRFNKKGRNRATLRYLKWDNDVVGVISPADEVTFIMPEYNKVVALYTHGQKTWSPEKFTEFLSERIVSRERRDIESILFRCGLSYYDVRRIAQVTRGIHPKDLLWIAEAEDEKLSSVMTDVFSSVFLQRLDKAEDTIDAPEGYNIKRYGVFEGKYGIYKQRINPVVTDVESEIAVYLLAKRLGVPCCPAVRTGKDTIFSAFLYNFSQEYVVHFRRLFGGKRGDNEYRNLLMVRPQYRDDITRMILLDFITRQDDRHLSNIAMKISGDNETFYPLYDNGRSLFYEDTEEMVEKAISDIPGYATRFGHSGTYWDHVREIAFENHAWRNLIDLDVSKEEIQNILIAAGFTGYRLAGSIIWIAKVLSILKKL